MAYREFLTWRKLTYDFFLWLLLAIFDCFFREIRARNGYKIPRTGPVIFVGAPHANQFVDPIILMGQVQKRVHRRVSFLIASKSLKRKVVGFLARCQLSIGVNRAQDNLRKATGKIFIKDFEDPTRIHGIGTRFTEECAVKGLIGLPNLLGNADIKEIISDNELIIRKEFNLKKSPKVEKLLSEGTEFKVAPKIDQSEVYEQVFEHLAHNNCIGIFPEGGSHDRTTLLPLKAGVAIMALGAMAHKPGLRVQIVPCGMNYFHPHKFRSRAVVEFGNPIAISPELVAKYQNPETNREAVKEVLDLVQNGLKAVTVQCDSYETLMVVQASRRLYQTNFAERLPLPLVHEFNRRIIAGYEKYKDEPEVKAIKEKILKYNQLLKDFHIADHMVETAEILIFRNFGVLAFRSIQILFFLVLALPGTILFLPIFIGARVISKKKAREALAGSVVKIKANDVVATWKILILMVCAPILYVLYLSALTWFVRHEGLATDRSLWLVFCASYALCVSITYAALIVGESGMDLFKGLIPVYLSLQDPIRLNNLKLQRRELAAEITEVVDKFGMEMYPDDFNLLETEKAWGSGFEEAEEDRKTQELRDRRRKKRKEMRKAPETDLTASESEGGSSSFIDSDGISRMNLNNSLSGIPVFSEYTGTHSSSASSVAQLESEKHDQGTLKDKIAQRMREATP